MEKPAFEIFEVDSEGKLVDWLYIFASGKVECSTGIPGTFVIVNRIPQLLMQAAAQMKETPK